MRIEGFQCLVAEFFGFRNDDYPHLLIFHIGGVADIGARRSAKSHSTATTAEILQLFIFPSKNIDDAGDLFCGGNIDAFHSRIRIRASEKFCVKHFGKDIVRAELRHARRDRIG